MTNFKDLTNALRATSNAATAFAAASSKALRVCNTTPGAYSSFYDSDEGKALREKRDAQLGRITVSARVGGNSRRQHVRHTFKIDGKRASREQVEELINARQA